MSPAEDCPHCNGTGFQLVTQGAGVLASTPCECSRKDMSERRLQAARIPKRYDHCSFEHFEIHDPTQEKARDLALDWIDRWPVVEHGLLLMGAPGTGKTHLAVAIARELIKKGGQVLFREQRELLKALQGTFETGSVQRESEILGPVQSTEVLLLDDLGAGRTTLWARDVMHDIIAHRYNEKKLMLITTNHSTGDEAPTKSKARELEAPLTLRDRLGDALMSRIYEMCVMVQLRTKEDYRRGVKNAQISR